MQKFFRSGAAFLVVAMLCVVAGLISKSGGVTSVGMFWLIMAIIVRGKYAKKAPPADKP